MSGAMAGQQVQRYDNGLTMPTGPRTMCAAIRARRGQDCPNALGPIKPSQWKQR
jgi:hypothetical protein